MIVFPSLFSTISTLKFSLYFNFVIVAVLGKIEVGSKPSKPNNMFIKLDFPALNSPTTAKFNGSLHNFWILSKFCFAKFGISNLLRHSFKL